MKKLTIKTAIAIGIGGLLFLLLCLMMSAFGKQNQQETYKALSNASFVVGILMVSFGLLGLIASDGTYDALAYSMSKTLSFLPFVKKSPDSFFEYKQQKKERAKNPMLPLIIAGLVWVAVAVIFMALFNTTQ